MFHFPPYEMIENNEPTGIAVEITKEVFKVMNQPIHIKLVPFSRVLHTLKTGQADGAIEILKTEERFNYIDYSEEVLFDEMASLFVLEESNIEFDGNLESIKNYTIGIRKDFSYGSIFDNALNNNIFSKVIIQVYDEFRLWIYR